MPYSSHLTFEDRLYIRPGNKGNSVNSKATGAMNAEQAEWLRDALTRCLIRAAELREQIPAGYEFIQCTIEVPEKQEIERIKIRILAREVKPNSSKSNRESEPEEEEAS